VRHLAEAWIRTASRVHARGDVAGAGANLLARYADPGRAYHDLRHLDEVLRNVDELADVARDADAVRLAAWFHDAVYDTTATDNEARSARLAETVLTELRVDPARIAEVARLVRVTATHEVATDDTDAAVLCDADLAILAAGPARYAEYVAGVRREHAQLSDADFARGRAVVLRALLAHEPLFQTAAARTEWEQTARANVTAELARLEPCTRHVTRISGSRAARLRGPRRNASPRRRSGRSSALPPVPARQARAAGQRQESGGRAGRPRRTAAR
jgi:predicted metal-dependent HD superfamily phosphohydrolase